MGELVVGRPVLRQLFAVSVPLVLTSAISLTHRARGQNGNGPDPGFDRWLIEARHSLDPETQHDLDLVLGFTGRLIYYIEELLFSFDALEPDRLDASYEQYFSHLKSLPADTFQQMAANAVGRVYRDRGVFELPPESGNVAEWRMFLRPSITHADLDEAARLVADPEELKHRTLRLIDRYWHECYQDEYERALPEMQRAVRYAQSMAHPVVQLAFSELTGHRLPDDLWEHIGEVERVTYCPSIHLGSFVQYIFYAPELILYFNPATVLGATNARPRPAREDTGDLDPDEALAGLKALADPTRIRIIEMLREREHYAQEIVSRLGISQSAVSRHLSTLDAARIIRVRPAQGMKYYAIDRANLQTLANYLDRLAGEPGSNGHS